MSAPAKSAGGKETKRLKAASPRARRNRRAESIQASAEGIAKATTPPRHDTSRSARPQILEAAHKMAALKGYEPLRVIDITSEAGISHQSFYGHFANKRHAVAIATSDELGAIADLAMRGSKQDERWAERLLADIDKALVEAYPATDGPERWLRNLLTDAISSDGGYDALRIAEMIKVSRLGHGEFYRRYGGKRGCLRRIYAETLEEIRADLDDAEEPLASFATCLRGDPDTSRLLILGAAHLPNEASEDPELASQGSLLGLVGEVISRSLGEKESTDRVKLLAGGVHEVIRSAVLAGQLDQLEELLGGFGARRVEAGSEGGGEELLAA